MSAFHNLTGSNVLCGVGSEYLATLPPGRSEWWPTNSVTITNGVGEVFTLSAPFGSFEEVSLQGADGSVHAIDRRDRMTEFQQGFALIVVCGLLIGTIKFVHRALSNNNVGVEL